MSTGFTVVPSLGDGVEGLLTFHTQCHLFLSDRSRSSFTKFHTALREGCKDRRTSGPRDVRTEGQKDVRTEGQKDGRKEDIKI